MAKHGIKHADYPEEVRYKAHLQEYRFFRRAAALQLLHAHNQVREELVVKRISEKFERQKQAGAQKGVAKARKGPSKAKAKNKGSVVAAARDLGRTKLPAIAEESGS